MFTYCNNNPVIYDDAFGTIPGRNDIVFIEDGACGGTPHVGTISSDDYQKYEQWINTTFIDRKQAFDESDVGKIYDAGDTAWSGIGRIKKGFIRMIAPEPDHISDLIGFMQFTYGVAESIWGMVKIILLRQE